jgi:hypothetical protein
VLGTEGGAWRLIEADLDRLIDSPSPPLAEAPGHSRHRCSAALCSRRPKW